MVLFGRSNVESVVTLVHLVMLLEWLTVRYWVYNIYIKDQSMQEHRYPVFRVTFNCLFFFSFFQWFPNKIMFLCFFFFCSQQCSINSPDYGPLPSDAPSWCQAPFDPEGLLRFFHNFFPVVHKVILQQLSCYALEKSSSIIRTICLDFNWQRSHCFLGHWMILCLVNGVIDWILYHISQSLRKRCDL